MKREVLYQYMGTNGILLSPIHLEGIYSIKKINLTADDGKKLTKDRKTFVFSITVPEAEEKEWFEVNA